MYNYNVLIDNFYLTIIVKEFGKDIYMKYSEFRKNIVNRYCRKCINEKLSFNLQKNDCIYGMYKNKCQSCKEMRNIVDDIKFSSRYKLLFVSGKDSNII